MDKSIIITGINNSCQLAVSHIHAYLRQSGNRNVFGFFFFFFFLKNRPRPRAEGRDKGRKRVAKAGNQDILQPAASTLIEALDISSIRKSGDSFPIPPGPGTVSLELRVAAS